MGFCKRKGVECEYKTICNIHPDSITVDSCQKNLHDVECQKQQENKEFNELMDTVKNLSCFWTPHLDEITGVVDTETDGRKFAIGTKNHADTFVLNFKDNSCLLFMGDIQPIDLRKFNFDEFTSIEINGNKFVREVK